MGQKKVWQLLSRDLGRYYERCVYIIVLLAIIVIIITKEWRLRSSSGLSELPPQSSIIVVLLDVASPDTSDVLWDHDGE